MSPEYTEMVGAVAIGMLSAIFISALVILILLCKRQRSYTSYLDHELSRNRYQHVIGLSRSLVKMNDNPVNPLGKPPAVFEAKPFIDDIYESDLGHDKSGGKPEVMLISPEKSEVEMNEVDLTNSLDKVLGDEQWVDDATGLIPHCLSILKTCRFLTERLTGLAMNTSQTSGNGLKLIVENARTISSRVDDMVKCMYPPLDPRLLEARAAALTLAVSHLVLIAKYECGHKEKNFGWIDKSVGQMNEHMQVLGVAASMQETSNKIPQSLNDIKSYC